MDVEGRCEAELVRYFKTTEDSYPTSKRITEQAGIGNGEFTHYMGTLFEKAGQGDELSESDWVWSESLGGGTTYVTHEIVSDLEESGFI